MTEAKGKVPVAGILDATTEHCIAHAAQRRTATTRVRTGGPQRLRQIHSLVSNDQPTAMPIQRLLSPAMKWSYRPFGDIRASDFEARKPTFVPQSHGLRTL